MPGAGGGKEENVLGVLVLRWLPLRTIIRDIYELIVFSETRQEIYSKIVVLR